MTTFFLELAIRAVNDDNVRLRSQMEKLVARLEILERDKAKERDAFQEDFVKEECERVREERDRKNAHNKKHKDYLQANRFTCGCGGKSSKVHSLRLKHEETGLHKSWKN